MPERIYVNRLPGQRRIHVELTEQDVLDLIGDVKLRGDAFRASQQFLRVLRDARDVFAADRAAERPSGAA